MELERRSSSLSSLSESDSDAEQEFGPESELPPRVTPFEGLRLRLARRESPASSLPVAGTRRSARVQRQQDEVAKEQGTAPLYTGPPVMSGALGASRKRKRASK